MRGATYSPWSEVGEFEISIHAPHAGRDKKEQTQFQKYQISIHAPHAGRDQAETGKVKVM